MRKISVGGVWPSGRRGTPRSVIALSCSFLLVARAPHGAGHDPSPLGCP